MKKLYLLQVILLAALVNGSRPANKQANELNIPTVAQVLCILFNEF